MEVFDLDDIREPICFFDAPFNFLSPLSFKPGGVDMLKDMFVFIKIYFSVLPRLHILCHCILLTMLIASLSCLFKLLFSLTQLESFT